MAENGVRFALTRREAWGLAAGSTAVGLLLFLAGMGAGAGMGCARAAAAAPPAAPDTAAARPGGTALRAGTP
jgi:hypothetical protein